MTAHKPTPKFFSGYFTKLVLLPTYLSLMKKEIATYSSIPAWEIPRTEEPDGLQPMASQESYTTEQLNHHHHSLLSFCQSVTVFYTFHSELRITRHFNNIHGIPLCRWATFNQSSAVVHLLYGRHYNPEGIV